MNYILLFKNKIKIILDDLPYNSAPERKMYFIVVAKYMGFEIRQIWAWKLTLQNIDGSEYLQTLLSYSWMEIKGHFRKSLYEN